MKKTAPRTAVPLRGRQTPPPPVGGAPRRFPIVGVGASAGGLEAFQELLRHIPANTGMAFVLVQHLDPEHKSALTELLARNTPMPVHEAKHQQQLRPDCVYVIPPNTEMTLKRGKLRLAPRNRNPGSRRVIDVFLESLAHDQQECAIGVVLSGTATDGTLGLEAVKGEGGVTFAQDSSAKYDSMPRSAAATGCVDFVLSPARIGAELARIAKHPALAMGAQRTAEPEEDVAAGASPAGPAFADVLRLLSRQFAVDFSSYKASTLQRRLTRRMVLTKHTSLPEYVEILKGDPKELGALYADMLIGVTSFFRNADAFHAIQHKVLPKLLAGRSPEEPVRMWVLGCSTGQEAYSLAMAFSETVRTDSRAPKLQIFATDLNEASLEKARAGLYPRAIAQELSPARLQTFFNAEDGGYRVVKSVREQVVFARHNVAADPPFSRIDLISCRNLLIYLEPVLQKKILPAFHYALKPPGYLFLGASESVRGFSDLFAPADPKQKIFTRKPLPMTAPRLPLPADRSRRGVGAMRAIARPASGVARSDPDPVRAETTAQREADRISINLFAPPGVLINEDGQVMQFRGETGAYLAPASGKASFDLLKMARDGLALALRSAINEAKRDGVTTQRAGVRVRENRETRSVTIRVIPLRNLKERCFLVLFEPSGGPAAAPLPEPPSRRDRPESRRQLAELERDLAETRDYLHSVQEQHEATNAELQAATEEAQSANEELQSINEELETSKEELESSNEELTTINDEMISRNADLSRLNADLVNLQASLHTPILLLSRELTLRRFTPEAEKMFNLLATDVGRPLAGVRHTLQLPDLEGLLREVVASVRPRDLDVEDRTGHWYALHARPYLSGTGQVDGVVLVLHDVDALKRSEQAIKAARDYAEAATRTIPLPYLVLRADLRVNTASDSFYRTFKVTPQETEGRLLYELGNGQWNRPPLRELLEKVLPLKTVFNDFEVVHEFPGLGRRSMLLSGRRLLSLPDAPGQIVLAIEDVTERKQAEEALRQSKLRLEFVLASAGIGDWDLDLVMDRSRRSRRHDEIFGHAEPPAEWGLKTLLAHVHPADRAEVARQFAAAIDRREECHLECRVVWPDGSVHWVELHGAVYRSVDGKARNLLGTVTDITARKAAEESMRGAMEEIARMSRAKDEFLATLSHELRTPLTPVLLTASALAEEPGLPADLHEQFRMIERNIALEARLIDDLLDLTKLSRGKLELRLQPVDVHALFGYALDIVAPDAAAKAITVECDLAAAPGELTVDPARFQQIIWNLLRNAVKFTPERGRIALRTRMTRKPDGARWLRIEVCDSGIGIDAAMLDKIFAPFHQGGLPGGHRFGGLGLGLAIARAVTKLHGGEITATSAGLGKGATFVVELPVQLPAEAGASRRTGEKADGAGDRPVAPEARSEPRRLLVVEDHESTLQAVARFLRRDGHEVVPVTSVEAALAAAAAGRFDLVISDIGLRDGDGNALMRQLRDTYGLSGIALSGFGADEDIARAREAGFVAHLIKPVRIAELRRTLAGLLARAAVVPQPAKSPSGKN